MNLDYTEKGAITNGETFGNNTVSMLLYGNIDMPHPDGSPHINSTNFVKEMNYYNSLGKHVVVKINSNGGSVYGGLAIMEAIEDNGADTYVTGMAGSIAGVLLQSGKQRFANKRASWMAHAPKSKSGEASKRHINIVRETLKGSLTDRSSLSGDSIEKIMNGPGELYFSAQELYEQGLVDKLIGGGKMLNLDLLNMSSKEMFTAYDSLLNNQSKPIQMENLMSHLGLENKTEADVINAVKNLEVEASKVGPLANENETLKAEVTNLKASAKEAQTEKAESLITNAIEAGKIKEDAKQIWLDLAVENFDMASSTLEAIAVTKAAPNVIATVVNQAATQTEGKTYEWYAENEPTTLVNLMKDNPEKFALLSREMNNNKRNN
jgi:ATP-dependent protease ClpP protease subunit